MPDIRTLILPIFLSLTAAAETLPQPPEPLPGTARPSENDLLPAAPPATGRTAPAERTVRLDETDLKNNPSLLEGLLTQAVYRREWALAADLLAVYRSLPRHDRILAAYVRGALLHQSRQTAQAIRLYRDILNGHPDLHYIRLNLAQMLLADKQPREAAAEFTRLQTQPDPAIQQATAHGLAEIRRQQAWRTDLSAQYERNNNINNASSAEVLEASGRTFRKNPESLPQTARGIYYGISAERTLPLSGHRKLALTARLDGRHYRDNRRYGQTALYLAPAYRYETRNTAYRIAHFVRHQWLDGRRYLQSHGISQNLNRALNNRSQSQTALTVRRDRYRDADLRGYNGRIITLLQTLVYNGSNRTAYGGIALTDNRMQKDYLSSREWDLHTGWAREWPQLGISVHAAYGREQYRAAPGPNTAVRIFYPRRRRDRSVQLDVSVWKPKWQYAGFTPKLNFSFRRTKSNMPTFYSRNRKQVYISVEKSF